MVLDELQKNHICGCPHELNMDKKGFSYEDNAYYGAFKVDVNSKVQYGTFKNIIYASKYKLFFNFYYWNKVNHFVTYVGHLQ